MKTIIFVITIFAFALNANAQKLVSNDVPDAVKTKFASMYPNVSNHQWEKEHGKYEAEFKENNVETSVLFEPSGMYVQTEVEIPVSSLPGGVNDYASKNLAGKKITEAVQITNADGMVTYEAEIGGPDYLFDSNGNFIKMESDDSDKEDNDKD
ncbi:MAG: PepSY-like domain-containing protein [Chlorobi bacterium]|nr:PepSY-like domain-containing protein [Chlorobiota bacterium]MCI0715536.1 PepSY-like domain-containing protein [Chlorobiota bacterium]